VKYRRLGTSDLDVSEICLGAPVTEGTLAPYARARVTAGSCAPL
jgi:aryl-alcohol dehydrogenase-like predicted oxidoreductase